MSRAILSSARRRSSCELTVMVAVGGMVEVRMKVSKTVVVMVVVVVGSVLGAQGVKIQDPQIGQRSMRGMAATRRYLDIIADVWPLLVLELL